MNPIKVKAFWLDMAFTIFRNERKNRLSRAPYRVGKTADVKKPWNFIDESNVAAMNGLQHSKIIYMKQRHDPSA